MPETSSNAEPCAVCAQTFKDPRELCCGHVYCCHCIQHIIDTSDSFHCPKCRENYSTLKCAADLQKCEKLTVKENHQETSNADENSRSICELCNVEELWKRFAYCSSHDLFMCAHCALFNHQNCSVISADDGARKHVYSNITRAQDVQQKVTTLETSVRKLDKLQEKLTKIVAHQEDQIDQVRTCLSSNMQLFDEAIKSEHAMAALIAQRKLEKASSEINSSHKTYSEMVDMLCKEAADFANAFEHVSAQYCEVVPEKIKLESNSFGWQFEQLITLLQQLADKGKRHTPAAIVKEVMPVVNACNTNQGWVAAMGKNLIFDTTRYQRAMFDFGNGFKLLVQNYDNLQYGNVDQAKINEYLAATTNAWSVINAANLSALGEYAAPQLGGIWLSVADPHESLAIARQPCEIELCSSSVDILGYKVTLYKLGG